MFSFIRVYSYSIEPSDFLSIITFSFSSVMLSFVVATVLTRFILLLVLSVYVFFSDLYLVLESSGFAEIFSYIIGEDHFLLGISFPIFLLNHKFLLNKGV